MSHGDDKERPGEGEQTVTPDSWVQQFDAGPVPAPAQSPERASGTGPDGGELAERSEDVDRSGDGTVPIKPINEQEVAALSALQIQFESNWVAPMPPPAMLHQYEQVLPGAADRILRMAETIATGKITTDGKLAAAEIERAKTGQAIALMITIISMSASIGFFMADMTIPGSLFLSFPVIMMIRAFLGRDK